MLATLLASLMIVVPQLPELGYSRWETVEFCAEHHGIEDYTNMLTDEELSTMEQCLIEMT